MKALQKKLAGRRYGVYWRDKYGKRSAVYYDDINRVMARAREELLNFGNVDVRRGICQG
jgi:hypothetical protein